MLLPLHMNMLLALAPVAGTNTLRRIAATPDLGFEAGYKRIEMQGDQEYGLSMDLPQQL